MTPLPSEMAAPTRLRQPAARRLRPFPQLYRVSSMSNRNELVLSAPSGEDIAELARLGAETFAESHGSQYEPQDLESFVAQVFAPSAVRAEWEDSRYAFRIAIIADRMIGYCKLGPASGEIEGDLELKQIFVRTDFYGTGIGPSLMQWAKAEAAARSAPTIGLSVWEGNARAIRFYEKHGFERTGTMSFEVGDKVETDITLCCAVEQASSRSPGRRVVA